MVRRRTAEEYLKDLSSSGISSDNQSGHTNAEESHRAPMGLGKTKGGRRLGMGKALRADHWTSSTMSVNFSFDILLD